MNAKALVLSTALLLGVIAACGVVHGARQTRATVAEKECGYLARTDASLEMAQRGEVDTADKAGGAGRCGHTAHDALAGVSDE